MKRLLLLIVILSVLIGLAFDSSLLFVHNSYVKTGNEKLLTDYLGKLDSAVTAIGATETTLTINVQPDSLSANLTIPTTLDLFWLKGYPLATTGTDTLFFDYGAGFIAGDYATFDTTLMIDGVPDIDRFNLKWYGALGDSAQDDTRYIQRVFDVVVQRPKVSATIYAPSGRYLFTQIRLGDSTQVRTDKGYITLEGERAIEGAWGDNNPLRIGTIFISTKTTGNCFIVNNEETPSDETERVGKITLKDFGVIGATSGKLFVFQSVSAEPQIENVYVKNTGSGIGAYLFNTWTGMFKNFDVTGGGRDVTDVAMWYDTEDGAGSMIAFDNCTWKDADYPARFGPNPVTHDGDTEEYGLGSNTLLTSVQMKGGHIGLQSTSGTKLRLEGCHFEGNDSLNVELHKGCAIEIRNTHMGVTASFTKNIQIVPNLNTLTEFNTNRLFMDNVRFWQGIVIKDSSRAHIVIENVYNNIATTSDTLIWFTGEFFGTVEVRNLIDNSQTSTNWLSNKPEWILQTGFVNRRSILLNTDTLDFQNTNWMPRSLYVTGIDDTCTIFFPGHANDAKVEQNWATTIVTKNVTNPTYIDVTAGGETNNRISKTGTDGVTFLATRDTLTTINIPRTYTPIVVDNRVIWNAY